MLLTSDSGIWFNAEIKTGDFRQINLLKPPYRLPQPYRVLRDDKVTAGRVLAVWRGSDLR